MVRKTGILSLFILIIVLSGALASAAYKVPLTIKTIPYHDVDIKIIDAYADERDENSLIESLNATSGETGEVSLFFNTTKSIITIRIIVKEQGRIRKINDKYLHELKEHRSGTSAYMTILPGKNIEGGKTETNETETTSSEETNETDSEEPEEATVETAEEPAETTETETSQITGAATTEDEGNSSLIIYVIALIVVATLLVAFFIIKSTVFKGPSNFKVRKYSEMKDELGRKTEAPPIESKESEEGEEDEKILEAEKKLEEAQEEIRKIKEKKSKLGEARKRYEAAKAELEKLESEKD